jgi:hypothetical protein
MDDVEEVILALKAAGMAMPQYKVLEDGSYYFYNGQENADIAVHSTESRGQVN